MPASATLSHFIKCTLAVAGLAWTAQASAEGTDPAFARMIGKLALAPSNEPASEVQRKTSDAVAALQRMAFPEASRAVNEALQLSPRNAHLHFLNGFVYHLQARQGDSQQYELATEGYQQALRIDPGNWIAREFLGMAHLDQRQFDQARDQFSEVLLMTPDSTVSLYGLMVASYLTGDAELACAMADQVGKAAPSAQSSTTRSRVAVYAACGQFDQARRMRDQYASMNNIGGNAADVARLDRRLAQWQAVYRPAAGAAGLALNVSAASALPLAQAFKVPDVRLPPPVRSDAAGSAPTPAQAAQAVQAAPPETPPLPGAPATADSGGGPRMVLVDVVLVSAQENVGSSKGVNLLNALTLQLGSLAGNLPAYSRQHSSSAVGAAAATVSTAITRAVTVPALSYSLNIANATDSVNEVLARPTLAAIEGMPSEFFSGTNLSAGVVSASTQGGTTVVPLEKRFGIKLAVTPTFLANGKVQLKVEAQRTSLNANVDNPKVAYQVEIGEITANANVVMDIGDTLVLSGLSEKSSARTRDGVPLLQDLPVVQYLFSNKKANEIQRSVLILVTPRAPAYTARADAGRNDGASASVQALRRKFGFVGPSASSAEAVLSHLAPNTLFREFREGDVTLERWERTDSTLERLRQALDFLYY
jgi:pilus assembly protein CpaC